MEILVCFAKEMTVWHLSLIISKDGLASVDMFDSHYLA